MGRQLFLHHYLPAHLASSLITGALLEFIFTIEPVAMEEATFTFAESGTKHAAKTPARRLPARERLGGQSLLASWAAAGVIMIAVIGGWYFFVPLTYGFPLTVDQVMARKWLGYDLHFAK